MSVKEMSDQRVFAVNEIAEDAYFAEFLPRTSREDYEGLRQSIATEGVRDPLSVWDAPGEDYVLVDGYRRIAICRELGIEKARVVVMEFESRDAVEEWMYDNQKFRRNMTPEQRDALAVRMMAKEAGEAKRGNPNWKNGDSAQIKQLATNVANCKPTGKASERVAAKLGTTARTVERAVARAGAEERIKEVDRAAYDKLQTRKATRSVSSRDIEQLAKAPSAEIEAAAAAIIEDRPIAAPVEASDDPLIRDSVASLNRRLVRLMDRVAIAHEAKTLSGADLTSIREFSVLLSEAADGLREFIGEPPPALPPKKPTKRKAYGEYGWVKLSDAEYGRIVAEHGAEAANKYITILDEYVQSNGNKNKYKDWNLQLRKVIRDKWGEGGRSWQSEEMADFSSPEKDMEFNERVKAIARERIAARERLERGEGQ
ncbi:MAG: ParB/RepB/Spo0J family partition protein [Chitinispirillales bacterium]|jgi:ParB-like chromosome segregation protein Spo0J|nr:ParB/RepB/Spo0J family partition protein [Chitinispirillales bacterium]